MPQSNTRANMLAMTGGAKVFLCQAAVNLRKSFEGLSKIVIEEFKEQLISNSYYIFINRERDLMKVLYFDGDGLAIWAKRLEKGRFPKPNQAKPIIERREFFMMLEGVIPKRMQKRFKST